jgi:mannose-6-phosphate isomerase-like protein (cupin superfamily)
MPLIDNSIPQTFDIPGVRFSAIASPSRGSRENAMWRAVVAPHNSGAVHHVTREELYLGVSGVGRIRIGETEHRLTPGDAFAVPAFTDFQVEAEGDAPFEAVVVLPAGAHAVVAGRPSFAPPWSV